MHQEIQNFGDSGAKMFYTDAEEIVGINYTTYIFLLDFQFFLLNMTKCRSIANNPFLQNTGTCQPLILTYIFCAED
jgi:hypothetical protein